MYVNINKNLLDAYNTCYRALDFHDNLTNRIRESHEKVLRESNMTVGFAKVGLERTKFIKSSQDSGSEDELKGAGVVEISLFA